MIRLKPACAQCLASKYTEKCPKDAAPETVALYQQKVREIIANADPSVPAPVVVRDINDMREALVGSRVVYSDIKSHFNQLMLSKEDFVRKQLASAEDPLLMGIRYAITGNFIDFGAFKNVDEKLLENALFQAEELTFDMAHYEELRANLASSRKLVYLTDNCGEVVMDKLVIEVLKKLHPNLQITVIVKGAEVLNDATMEDALEVGLPDVVPVIDNGNNIAGSWLPEFSPQAMAVVEEADLILSKGQANFETLRCCGRNIYYMFLCKCDFFADTFGVPLLTAMLTTDKEIARLEN